MFAGARPSSIATVCRGGGKGLLLQSLAFGFQAGSGVDICCVETFMAGPVANHFNVDTGREERV